MAQEHVVFPNWEISGTKLVEPVTKPDVTGTLFWINKPGIGLPVQIAVINYIGNKSLYNINAIVGLKSKV